ncbi:MAG: hypothetical protein ACJ8AH_06320 [Stellaceae bacterium]
MTTIDDINAEKKAAVTILDQKIFDAIERKNAGVSDAQERRLDQAIHVLMVCRSAVFVQAYTAALGSAAMKAALNALKAATVDMNKVAARMRSVTTIINNAADLAAGITPAPQILKNHSRNPTALPLTAYDNRFYS